MTGAQVWSVLGAVVVVYELTADEEQLLTNSVRRGRAHPIAGAAITAGIVCVAGHLLDVWGPADPFRLLALSR